MRSHADAGTVTLPAAVQTRVERAVGPIHAAAAVGGGSVGHALRVETDRGVVFVKWAVGDAGSAFAAEADGLAALARAAPSALVVPVPLVAENARDDAPGVLVLPWLHPGRPEAPAWQAFGSALADLHRVPSEAGSPGAPYGQASDNWIGSKPQRNGWARQWPLFFGERRLLAQAATVRERGAWQTRWDAPLERLVAMLPDMLPDAPEPSVLHGDLWSGNAVALADGRFALIDPAHYVGHRETDLAMTTLFGGFPRAFYRGYREAWPLEPGDDERREVYNLYHLINHLTHGPGYAASVEAVLRKYR